MKKLRWQKPAFIIYAIEIAVLIYLISPKVHLERLIAHPTVGFSNSPVMGANPTFQYLGNAQRTQQPVPQLEWPFKKLWEQPNFNFNVHDASKASVAADSSGLYVGSDTGWFYALKLDRQIKWRFQTGLNPSGIHGTALLDEHNVYVGAYNGRFYALDKETGELRWVKKIADAIGSSPFLWQRDLFISSEFDSQLAGYLIRVSSTTGEEIWRSTLFREQVHASPTLSEDGSKVFVGDNAGLYRALNAESGDVLWTRSLGGAIKGTGVYADNKIYVASWGKALFALNATDGQVVWSTPLNHVSQSSPVLINGVVVVSTHRKSMLYGIDASNGRILWQKSNVKSNLEGISSPVVFYSAKFRRSFALVVCEHKLLCVLEPRSGRVLYKYEVPGLITSVPTVFAGKIYLTFKEGPLLALGN